MAQGADTLSYFLCSHLFIAFRSIVICERGFE